MLDRRTEKIAQVIFFLLMFAVLEYFIPNDKNTYTNYRMSYLIDSLFFTYVVSWCYTQIRNVLFRHKIGKYIVDDKYDVAINLLDAAIERQPRITWLRIERAIYLGISWKIDRFWEEYNLIYENKDFCTKKNYKLYFTLIAISDGINFINNSSAKTKLPESVNGKKIEKYLREFSKHIPMTIYFYQNKKMDNAIYHASWMYNENSIFSKRFSSFILENAYENLGEIDKASIYRKNIL